MCTNSTSTRTIPAPELRKQPVAKQAFRCDSCKHRLPFLWAIHAQSKMYLGTTRKNLYQLDTFQCSPCLSQAIQTHTWCICSTFSDPKSCQMPTDHKTSGFLLPMWGKTASCIVLKNAKWVILYSQLSREAHSDQCISQHEIYKDMEYGTTTTFQACKLMHRHQTTHIPIIENVLT